MVPNIVATKVEIIKANNGGVAPYGAISAIVNNMKPTLPWLSKGMVRNHMTRQLRRKETKAECRLWSSSPGSTGSKCHPKHLATTGRGTGGVARFNYVLRTNSKPVTTCASDGQVNLYLNRDHGYTVSVLTRDWNS
jgi:hypothetical protein